MRHSTLPLSPLLLACSLLLVLVACSDDDGPAGPVDGGGLPQGTPWNVVELPAELPDGALTAVALRANASAAVGTSLAGDGILLQNSSQGWREVESPALESAWIQDAAIDGMGRVVMVGFSLTGTPLVLTQDQPGLDWDSALPGSPPSAGLLAVAVDELGTFLSVGTGTSSIAAWTGTAESAWTPVAIPTPGDPNDKALVDLARGPGSWVACGYDDGGEGTPEQPFRILMQDDGDGWNLIAVPCGGCGNREFRAVAVNDVGAIYLGGAITDFSAGAEDEYVAFLLSYSPDIEEWTEIVLPLPGSLDRVNEILRTSNGDLYLACGVENASLVRLPAGGSSLEPENIEWSTDLARIHGLGVSDAGLVHAVGMLESDGHERPFMLRRGEENPGG